MLLHVAALTPNPTAVCGGSYVCASPVSQALKRVQGNCFQISAHVSASEPVPLVEIARTFLLLGNHTAALDAVHLFTTVNRRLVDVCAATVAPQCDQHHRRTSAHDDEVNGDIAGNAAGPAPASGDTASAIGAALRPSGAVATAIARLRLARFMRAAGRGEAGAVFVAAMALEQQGRGRMAYQAMQACAEAHPRHPAYARGVQRLRRYASQLQSATHA